RIRSPSASLPSRKRNRANRRNMERGAHGFAKNFRTPATLSRPGGVVRSVFSRKNIGGDPQKCEKCGSDKVFLVQHAHENYPILDYVCPKCDLGGDQGVPDWYVSPTGRDESTDE